MDPNTTPQTPAAPVTTPTTSNDPGHTLGIVALVLAFISSLIGFILGIVAFQKSKKAGKKNNIALAAIIIGGIFTVIGIIVAILIGVAAAQLASKCAELGNGTHVVSGVTYTCGTSTTISPSSSY